MNDEPPSDTPTDDTAPSTAEPAVPTVRTARESDLPRLLAIQTAAFPAPHRTLLRSGVRTGLALVATEGPAETAALTGDEGPASAQPVGYALFTVDDESVYVAELAVAPGHRRRGHGRRLLAAVAARHPERDQLRLTTRADDERARAFYGSLGFHEVRTLPGYYDEQRAAEGTDGPGLTDGVLLVRDLE